MKLSSGTKDPCRRIEYELAFNDYKQIKTVTEISAKYRHILNILFMKPGTVPSTPEMGIDLERFQFMPLTSETLSSIKERITDQVKTYVSPSEGISVSVENYEDGTDYNSKKVAIIFKDSDTIVSNRLVTSYTGIIYDLNNKVLSPLYNFVN